MLWGSGGSRGNPLKVRETNNKLYISSVVTVDVDRERAGCSDDVCCDGGLLCGCWARDRWERTFA